MFPWGERGWSSSCIVWTRTLVSDSISKFENSKDATYFKPHKASPSVHNTSTQPSIWFDFDKHKKIPAISNHNTKSRWVFLNRHNRYVHLLQQYSRSDKIAPPRRDSSSLYWRTQSIFSITLISGRPWETLFRSFQIIPQLNKQTKIISLSDSSKAAQTRRSRTSYLTAKAFTTHGTTICQRFFDRLPLKNEYTHMFLLSLHTWHTID